MMQGTLGLIEVTKWALGLYCVANITRIGDGYGLGFALMSILLLSAIQGILQILGEIEKHLRELKELKIDQQ